MQSLYNTIRRRLRSVQPVRIEYAGTIVQGRHFEVADFQSVEARRLITMLGCGIQSCVRTGDKAGEHRHKSGDEAHRFSLEHVSTPYNWCTHSTASVDGHHSLSSPDVLFYLSAQLKSKKVNAPFPGSDRPDWPGLFWRAISRSYTELEKEPPPCIP